MQLLCAMAATGISSSNTKNKICPLLKTRLLQFAVDYAIALVIIISYYILLHSILYAFATVWPRVGATSITAIISIVNRCWMMILFCADGLCFSNLCSFR